jgi:hypothetical protein
MTTADLGFLKKITIDHLWLLAPLVLFCILLSRTPLHEGDLWWSIKLGEQITKAGIIPETDSFTFTAHGSPYLFGRSWLSEVLFFELTRIGGLPALILIQAFIGTAIISLVIIGALRRNASARLAGITGLIGILGFLQFCSVRSQIFSFLYFGIFFTILTGWQRGKGNRYLFLLPIIMVLWVNMHPGWVTGVLIITLYMTLAIIQTLSGKIAFSNLRPLLIFGFLSIFILAMNPYGLGVLRDPLAAGKNSVIQLYISEWQPVIISDPYSWLFFALLGLFLVFLAFSQQRINLYDFCTLLIFGVLALRYVRGLPYFYLTALPVLAGLAMGLQWKIGCLKLRETDYLSRRANRGYLFINWLIVAIMMGVALLNLPQVRIAFFDTKEDELISNYFPKRALDYLDSQKLGNMHLFSLAEWGGYIIYRIFPEATIFADGRIELIPDSVWSDYFSIATASQGWHDLSVSYSIDGFLLSKARHSKLILAIQEAGYLCPYNDEISVICFFRASE